MRRCEVYLYGVFTSSWHKCRAYLPFPSEIFLEARKITAAGVPQWQTYSMNSSSISTVPPPLTLLRSPYISISLGNPMEADFYGLDKPPSTPLRKVVLDTKTAASSVRISATSPIQLSRVISLLKQPALNPLSSVSALMSPSSEPSVILLSIPAPESVQISLYMLPSCHFLHHPPQSPLYSHLFLSSSFQLPWNVRFRNFSMTFFPLYHLLHKRISLSCQWLMNLTTS